MTKAAYDKIDDFYLKFVQSSLQNPHSLFSQSTQFLVEMIGDVAGRHLLDLCCGEGHFARTLAHQGAIVVGADISEVNLAKAKQTSAETSALTFVRDDAQSLSTFKDQRFDVVVCKMALMDIPDINATCQAVHRVLKPDGRFIAALLHPCFETPFRVPFERVETDEAGQFKYHRVQRYFDEGLWYSGGTGVRGHVGAHHRTLSTYINSLLANGLRIVRLEEPQLHAGEMDSPERQWSNHVPNMLFIEAKVDSSFLKTSK